MELNSLSRPYVLSLKDQEVFDEDSKVAESPMSLLRGLTVSCLLCRRIDYFANFGHLGGREATDFGVLVD